MHVLLGILCTANFLLAAQLASHAKSNQCNNDGNDNQDTNDDTGDGTRTKLAGFAVITTTTKGFATKVLSRIDLNISCWLMSAYCLRAILLPCSVEKLGNKNVFH